MPIGYVVAANKYEYNDNTYDQCDGFENLHKIYTNEDVAYQKCQELERKEWRGIRIAEWASDWQVWELSTGYEEDEIIEKIKEIFSISANPARELRRKELETNLSNMLRGNALQAAIKATLNEEFEEDEDTEEDVDLQDFEVPSDATDEQLDRLMEVFDELRFYTVVPMEIE